MAPKDRDRQGPGNVGAGNKGPAAGAAKGPAAGAAKGPAAASEKEKGVFGGIKDFFSGGAKSGPTAANRSKARPDVVKTGAGKDMRFMDTRTGQSFAAPEYGAFSFRGLTSTDPANVARNRYGAERAMAAQAERDRRDGPDRSGIASLQPEAPTEPAPAAPTPAELAMIGAPTTPMAPIFVDSPVYGMGGQNPAINYGTAFMGGPQMTPMNFLDIFAAYPNLGMR
jgi:hypothetical protein